MMTFTLAIGTIGLTLSGSVYSEKGELQGTLGSSYFTSLSNGFYLVKISELDEKFNGYIIISSNSIVKSVVVSSDKVFVLQLGFSGFSLLGSVYDNSGAFVNTMLSASFVEIGNGFYIGTLPSFIDSSFSGYIEVFNSGILRAVVNITGKDDPSCGEISSCDIDSMRKTLLSFLPYNCDVLQPINNRNDLGDVTTEWVIVTSSKCNLRQVKQSEPLVSGGFRHWNVWECDLPLDTPIESKYRIRINGFIYNIEGFDKGRSSAIKLKVNLSRIDN